MFLSYLCQVVTADCHACYRCYSYTRTALMPENMCPLKNKSITIKPIVMNLAVNLLTVGNQMKIAISEQFLSGIFNSDISFASKQ